MSAGSAWIADFAMAQPMRLVDGTGPLGQVTDEYDFGAFAATRTPARAAFSTVIWV
jgi:hypothetical protein